MVIYIDGDWSSGLHGFVECGFREIFRNLHFTSIAFRKIQLLTVIFNLVNSLVVSMQYLCSIQP